MSSVSEYATDAMRRYLVAALPAAIAASNAAKHATVSLGPFPVTVPSGGGWLGLTTLADEEITDRSSGTTEIAWYPISAGSYTAAQMVTALGLPFNTLVAEEFSAAVNGALVDVRHISDISVRPVARIVGYPPSDASVQACLASVLGLDAGGETAFALPLGAITSRCITDGFPAVAPDMNAGMWVVIGDRGAAPHGESSLRRDTWAVRMQMFVLVPASASAHHRTRDSISRAVGAVESCLLSSSGRYLGRESVGDVVGLEVLEEKIDGQPMAIDALPGMLFDTAMLEVEVRIHHRF